MTLENGVGAVGIAHVSNLDFSETGTFSKPRTNTNPEQQELSEDCTDHFLYNVCVNEYQFWFFSPKEGMELEKYFLKKIQHLK